MSYKKMITLESAEWLSKAGDGEKLLVQYSVVDKHDLRLGRRLPGVKGNLTVRLTDSASLNWSAWDLQLRERANLEKELLHFAFRWIKGETESGKEPSTQLIEITKYTTDMPVPLGAIRIKVGKRQEVIVQGKSGS